MRRRYTKVGDVLAKILDNTPARDSWQLEQIKKMWTRLDPVLVKHSQPVTYFNKTVILKTENEMWKTEFEKNKEAIVLKLKTFLHGVKVENVEFTM